MKSPIARLSLVAGLLVATTVAAQSPGLFPFPHRINDYAHQKTRTATRSHISSGDTLRYLNAQVLYTSEKDSLWIFWSRFADEKAARFMMQQMLSNIRSNKGNYQEPTSDVVLGVPIHSTAKKGRAHFFFRKKEQIFWLAGSPGQCYLFLKDFLKKTGLASDAKSK